MTHPELPYSTRVRHALRPVLQTEPLPGQVEVLQRSYRLLRQKLDFPPEDIILDCHLQTLRHDEHPSEVPCRRPQNCEL